MSASISNRRRNTRVVCVAVPVVIVIVVLLLLRGCGEKPGSTPTPDVSEALFVPRDLARLKQLDRNGVLDYCRTQIRPAGYDGILRGAHGALWAGEANAWDRVLLAAAALEGLKIEVRVVPGEPPRLAYQDGSRWTTVRIDVPGDSETTDQPPAGAIALADLPTQRPDLFHTIQAAFVLDQEGGGEARIPATDRVADWVFQPVSINTVGNGADMKLRLQVGNLVTQSVGVDGVRRARLELTWRYKEQSATWTRELFDRANTKPDAPGHDAPRTGDRYAIVLAAGPLVPEVLTTRSRMFELPLYTPVEDEPSRELLRLGTKYQVDGDEQTRKIAEEIGVAVAWTTPRIAIVAAETPPDGKGDPGLSMDALADSVDATGKWAREFHVARGLATDLVETRVLYEARRQPVVSTSTVFSNFKADSPDSPARRVAKIETEARRMLAEEPIGSTVVLTAMPPRAVPPEVITKTPNRPRLVIERTPAGLALRGLKQLDKADVPWAGYEWAESATVAFADRVRELATVADGMLARKAGHLDYMLAFEVRSLWPRQSLPIANGSILTYVAKAKDKTERIAVTVGLANGSTIGAWTNLDSGKTGTAVGKWPDALIADAQGLTIGSFFASASGDGDAIELSVRVGENVRQVPGRIASIANGSATVLAGDSLPILLEWNRGDASLRLESASPVVRGATLDADTGLPAAATVALTRTVRVPVRTEIDLRKWKVRGPKKNGDWQVAADGRSVLQKVNGDPTFFISPDEFIDTTIRGKLRVDDRADDDYIGFVFGYRSPLAEKGHKDNDFDYLLFDWKKADQDSTKEGFALVRVRGNFDLKEDGEYVGFWDRKKSEKFDFLATNYGAGKGWKAGIDHEFELTYSRDRIRIAIDGKQVFDVNGKFEPGRFGFYNYSQEKVRYSGFANTVLRETHVDVRKIDTAADGSFALAVPAERRRLILVLDRSGSMVYGLDPKDGRSPRDPPAPAGKQRMDYLRTAVNGLLNKVPAGVEVALWSFSTGPLDRDNDSPRHTTIDCPFTTDMTRVRKAMAAIKPANGTPITGAVHKVLDHIAQDPLSANAQVVLLTDGENSSRNPAAKAYRDRSGGVVIHTIGFAIEPGGKAEKELRELADVSGGRFQIAGTGEELALAFGKVGTVAPDTRLAVTSTCHAPTDVMIPSAQLGGDPLDIRLTHGCSTCKCTGKQLLTIRKESVAKLGECEGLSPKARTMIEERVRDGRWTVTIPSVRVNLGVISAYAWWETEDASGRMVGRTEDGLHGATIDPRSWPGAAAGKAGTIPFVAWYTGIVAYTMGSVDAAMRWTREPGFMAGGPEGFKRFVQANALDFAGRWWSEVGASAFPQNIHNYWSGVCLNFTLQSMALGLPASNCFRQWAGAMCDQAAGTLKDTPKDVAGKVFDDHFGEQYRDLYARAKAWSDRLGPNASQADRDAAKGLFDDLDKFKKAWDDGVDQALPCDRIRGKR